MTDMSVNKRAAILSFILLFAGLLLWEAAIPAQKAAGELTEYERLTGGGAQKAGAAAPEPGLEKAWEQLSNPFYDAGPNDKGIGIQIGYSIYRVLAGYFLAALIAIPLGFLIGMSPVMPTRRSIRSSRCSGRSRRWRGCRWRCSSSRTAKPRAIFVIFICSIWPMLINTAFGVAGRAQGLGQRRPDP
jgi:nitrate/nitrite transport system permease protein